MDHGDSEFDPMAETTEQALVRLEAECGWSDLARFADTVPTAQAVPVSAGERSKP